MKKSLALIAILSASVALADDPTPTVSANVYGVLRVETSAEEAIIAVPWLEPSVDGSAIAVTNVIKTANLTAGDELYYYDLQAKSYKAWKLNAEKKWESPTMVSVSGAVAGSDQTLLRGNALLLKRTNAVTRASAVYLLGQVATSATAEVTMAQGTESAPAYTLLAPPAAADTDLNDANAVVWSGVNVGDSIVLNDMTMLNWDAENGRWGRKISEKVGKVWQTTYDASKAVILAGQGAWYVSAPGATAAPSATWKALPSVGE